ncbi:MAG TPA: pitrilysin family protein [Pyrinomonadaceae bacterium]|nr:pitrilysin family protein [Pyrinomonadaceae bacterium]
MKAKLGFILTVLLFGTSAYAQLPEPGPARSVQVPAVKEATLKNGLRVAVVERKAVPSVSVSLVVNAGSDKEDAKKAGLARLTASLLTKGTKTRTATEIAEQSEFNASSIFGSAQWHTAGVGMGVLTSGFDTGMEIFADVVRNPSFPQSEIDLLKTQSLAGLKSSLSQPSSLANYASSVYSFHEHPVGGTPASIEALTRSDVESFYQQHYRPAGAVLIFVGDITLQKAVADAEKYFGTWANVGKTAQYSSDWGQGSTGPAVMPVFSRFLVIDLPESGQASVNYFKRVYAGGRKSKDYYTATVLNSLLGGGYSSRLNQEIRIKRGLSYGAGSNFGWRNGPPTFNVSTQTKDVSAAEVADLIVAELKRLADTTAAASEFDPRKAVLTGTFGRSLETNNGIASAVANLYSLGVSTSELNSYMGSVDGVSNAAVRDYAKKYFVAGDIVIVGDYSKFKDDLAKRFPTTKIDVVKASDLDIESPTLRKGDVQ